MNKSAIIGTLLGDAWIQKQKNNYQFAFQQSTEDYALWKAQRLKVPYSYKTYDRIDKRSGKRYQVTHVGVTLAKEIKKELYSMFYTPIKEVSNEVINLIDLEAILIWFLDDGSTYYNGNNCHITLSTNGFSPVSIAKIIEFFKTGYELSFKKGTNGSIRLVSRKECEKFMKLIESGIPDCMRHKRLTEVIDNYSKNLPDDRKKFRNKKYQTA